MWLRALLLGAALVGAAATAAPAGAQAQPRVAQPDWIMPTQAREQDERRRTQDIRPLREVVEELRARHGGELINARLEDAGRPLYVIRWRMPDGQVRDFRVSAVR